MKTTPTFLAKCPLRALTAVSLGAAVLTAGLFFATPRVLADDMSGPTAGTNSVAAADKEFMLAAAQGGMTEVKLGQVAAQTGASQEVKDFGAMMVTDHTAINNDLKALAGVKGVAIPDGLDSHHQKMVDKLSGMSGPDFDKAYVAAMVKAHKKDLKAFQAEDKATQDPEVKSFVEKSIPVITAHLEHVENLSNKLRTLATSN